MFSNLLFLLSALLTIGGCIMVCVTRNIMHACIYLLTSLIGMAGLYATLGADFVAVTQIMVYVGGIVILMLFAVMLTGGKDFVSKAQNLLGLAPAMGSRWTFFVGIFTATVFLLTNGYLFQKMFLSPAITGDASLPVTVNQLGYLLIKDHVLTFELSSVLLLGSLVGAAIIARPNRHEGKK
jgi:NADH-quinone oxidoreductase subunit J